jgi:hypothetical protein
VIDQRMQMIIKGHYCATDFLGRTIDPLSTVAYAVHHKQRKAKVIDILWDKDAQKCTLVVENGKGPTEIDPKRCLVV